MPQPLTSLETKWIDDEMDNAGNDITRRIRQRSLELLQRCAPLCSAHGATLPDPLIRFDLRGQSAGQVQWRKGCRPLLRYNMDIARRHETDFLAVTVAHEVAHLVTAACHGRTRPHGSEWRKVMAFLGIAHPQRCHQYALDDDAVKRQRRWRYACDCGKHELSTTRHNRIQAGATSYHCRACGSPLRPARCPGD
jgi:SprT protein